MKKFFIGNTTKEVNLGILRLKQEIREAEVAVQKTIQNHITSVCETDPELIEWSSKLGVSIAYIANYLTSGRDQVLWSWLSRMEAPEGHEGLLKRMEKEGLLYRTYYYDGSEFGCGDERLGSEAEKDFYKCDDGMWACPIQGEEITEDDFDERTYPMFSTSEIYEGIWNKLSVGIDKLVVIE